MSDPISVTRVHFALAYHKRVLLWLSTLASPFLDRCCVLGLVGRGAVVWVQTLILLRFSGLCRPLGNAHQPSLPFQAVQCTFFWEWEVHFGAQAKTLWLWSNMEPEPTWNPSLKFPIWWTALVSNLLNQFETLLSSCVLDHETRLTWPVRGLVRLHGELH